MYKFHQKYRPLTARPFLFGPTYAEYAPCETLKPYVACFWETSESTGRVEEQRILVIPDTCADVIIEINHSMGTISSKLCGLWDSPITVVKTAGTEESTSIAVRFHFWALRSFIPVNLRELYNQALDMEMIYPGFNQEIKPLCYLSSVKERIAWLENYLTGKLCFGPHDSNLCNAVDYIIKSSGSATVKEICQYSCVSNRQMERLFVRDIGISIKRTASLVRYQNVWRDIVTQEHFRVQDAVCRYGYADQSHLLNEFRRFHGATPDQAKRLALENR